MKWANEILDRLQKVFSKIIYIDGNHCETRVKNFREKYASVNTKHIFNSYLQMKLDQRRIEYINYNDWLDIGELSITHCMYHGSSCHKKHYLAAGGNSVVFSHVHHVETHSYVSRGKTKMSWSLPAMCSLNPEYLKNQEQNWSNGYGTIHFRPNGFFNLYIHNIWDNQLILPSGHVIVA
jgi:hypothetical protein